MTPLERLNRAQTRKDRWQDLCERALCILTYATVIGGGGIVLTLFAQTLHHLQRSW